MCSSTISPAKFGIYLIQSIKFPNEYQFETMIWLLHADMIFVVGMDFSI